MHSDERELLERVERIQNERVRPQTFRTIGELDVHVWQVPGDGEPVDPAIVLDQEFTPATLPLQWGRAWSTWWFRVDGTIPEVPEDLPADSPIRLEVDLGYNSGWPGNQCEGMLFRPATDADASEGVHGGLVPVKALNSRNRQAIIADATPGESVRLYIEAAANPDLYENIWFPTEIGDRLTAPDTLKYTLTGARFVVRDEVVWGLYHDIDILFELLPHLSEDAPRRHEIAWALSDALDVLDVHDVRATAQAARDALAPVLSSPAVASALEMHAIGHAHIDSAWLWPVRETVRKVGRTFSNVTALMDEYPDMTFTATSAQQYKWLRESRPAVYARVREAIKAGRWFPSGGMWVESDVNMPGGEALVRQFAYGTRFFADEFGVRSRTLWLPDSFGYPASLPQIALRAGMTGFLTQKLSWSRTNKMPHSTFWWEGIDGSRIFAHMPPVNCYDSEFSGEEINRAVVNFKDKGRAKAQVLPFGYGDGGGGPTPMMIERARRLADLEGAPKVSMDDPDSFFAHARAELGARAATHRGELYLEFHRGVYTSQLEMKQGNRRSEHGLRLLELIWTMVELRGLGRIDQAEVDELWERVLLLQFHDILPGSSIAWVHRDARADYERIAARIAELTEQGLALLAGGGGAGVADGAEGWPADETADAAGEDAAAGPIVVNAAGHARRAVIDVDGAPALVEVPGSGVAALADARVEATAPVTATRDGDAIVLANALVSARIEADGTLSSVRDLAADREVLVEGSRANELQMFEDLPTGHDAWDVERHYRRKQRHERVAAPTSIEIVEDGGLRAVVRIERMLGGSPAIQTVELDADSPVLRFSLDVDWSERETLLKTAFPLAVAAHEHRAEIQFGHVTRHLHENTTWEFAKFETPHHRWVLASEPGYGAALVNDSSYGYDALQVRGGEIPGAYGTGTQLRLTLMRSPNWPDPRADLSRRMVRYGLLVGADVVSANRAGVDMNLPLAVSGGAAGTAVLESTSSTARGAAGQESDERAAAVDATALADGLVRIAQDGVMVDAILPAHDGSGDVIVRLHETEGRPVAAEVALAFAAAAIREVDLHDDAVDEPVVDATAVAAGDAVAVPMGPFRIMSLRVTPAR